MSPRRLPILVYANQYANAKRYNYQKYYLSTSIIENYNTIINGINFYEQAIESDLKPYKQYRN